MTISYGDVLRMRRKELGLSQSEVADRACVHRTTVSKMECNVNNTSLDAFLSVANALGLKLELTEVTQ